MSASLKPSPPSESKLLSYQNKGFFEYVDAGKHPQAIVCVIGRKIFPTKSQWVCLGEIQNTRVVCSVQRSLPTVASIQKVLLFLVNFFAHVLHPQIGMFQFASGCSPLRFLYNSMRCRDRTSMCFYFWERKWIRVTDFIFFHITVHTSDHTGSIVQAGCKDELFNPVLLHRRIDFVAWSTVFFFYVCACLWCVWVQVHVFITQNVYACSYSWNAGNLWL